MEKGKKKVYKNKNFFRKGKGLEAERARLHCIGQDQYFENWEKFWDENSEAQTGLEEYLQRLPFFGSKQAWIGFPLRMRANIKRQRLIFLTIIGENVQPRFFSILPEIPPNRFLLGQECKLGLAEDCPCRRFAQ